MDVVDYDDRSTLSPVVVIISILVHHIYNHVFRATSYTCCTMYYAVGWQWDGSTSRVSTGLSLFRGELLWHGTRCASPGHAIRSAIGAGLPADQCSVSPLVRYVRMNDDHLSHL